MQNEPRYFCKAPFVHLMIGTNNILQICCSSEKSHIANMSEEQNVMDVWVSEKYKQLRQNMLDNEPLEECQSCYKIEDAGGVSDRLRFNSKFKGITPDVDTGNDLGKPISFDLRPNNLCNLNCVMCGPDSSTQIEKEINENKDLYRLSSKPFTKSLQSGMIPIIRDKKFDWLDNLEDLILDTTNPSLKLLGGEPSLIPEHMRIMTKLVENNNVNGTLEITTNLTNLNQKFVDILSNFKKVMITCSVDGIGPTLEYIRHPINYSAWRKNLQKLISISEASKKRNHYFKVELHYVVQIYNVYHLPEFLEFAEKLRVEHNVEYSFTVAGTSGASRALSVLYAPDSDRKIIANKLLDIMKKIPTFFVEDARLPAIINLLLTEAPNIYNDKYPLAVYTLVRDIPKNRNLKDSLPEVYRLVESVYDKLREDMLQYTKKENTNE